jgi:hypothetical protein
MTILFTLVNLTALAVLSRWEWKRLATSDTLTYWTSLSLRLAGGLAIGILYKYYYHIPGDTFVFFNDAAKLAELFYSNSSEYFKFVVTGNTPIELVTTEPRSVFFVAILSVVNIVTHNNYWLSSLWFSFFAFWCSYKLVVKLDKIFPTSKMASRIALLFVPSVVVWSSGIIKESLAFGAIAILAIHFLSMMRSQRLKWTGFLAVGFYTYLLLSLKYYWGAVLIPSMATSLIVHWTFARTKRNVWALTGVWILVFVLLSMMASFTHPNFYMERFLSVIVDNHDTFVRISDPDNVIEFYNLSADWGSVFINSPWALWSGLFRPMIFEAGSMIGVAAALENLFFLVLVFWKLRSTRMPLDENKLIVMAAVVYIVVLCIFLALSTPNFGTLSRYRVGFLPFFVLLVLKDHPVGRFGPVFRFTKT